ncbi:hypothetical protein A2661_01080 [Candidatus Giovannonibacteria bacterium RIFCSPHIGHO2_01_FULL_45_24]|nr:MAG: hypothetical protein A2661_01080 [Candidatus Giovannonibacteria bacterium RIFCSPHIGHO2_01_FULL_45_24]
MLVKCAIVCKIILDIFWSSSWGIQFPKSILVVAVGAGYVEPLVFYKSIDKPSVRMIIMLDYNWLYESLRA